jgi:aspartate racemase
VIGAHKKIGVLGGMGPAATLLFYRMVVEHTLARSDQEHIDMILLNHASMPDRTLCLRSGRRAELLEKLTEDARTLEACGADCVVIPCNTSHTLADEIQAAIRVPLINMVREAVKTCAPRLEKTGGRIGILATDGTVEGGIYQRELEKAGFLPYAPSPESQRLLMRMIYEGVKKGCAVDREDFARVDRELREAGCAGAIVACTELSILRDAFQLPAYYTDALLALARRAIAFAGRECR